MRRGRSAAVSVWHRGAGAGLRRLSAMLALVAAVPVGAQTPSAVQRVVVSDSGSTPTMDAAIAAIGRAHLVVLSHGLHDEAVVGMELRLIDAVAAKGRPVMLSIGLFGRDEQPRVDAFLAGTLPEDSLWTSYYAGNEVMKQVLRTARDRHWRVLAPSLTGELRRRGVTRGMKLLAELTPDERRTVATDVPCAAEGRAAADAVAQLSCLQLETQAEAIVGAVRDSAVVFHFSEAFLRGHPRSVAPLVVRRAPTRQTMAVFTARVPKPEGVLLRPFAQLDYVFLGVKSVR
jgi:Haem-binding uptake, Tiki superfamily, ChaN